MGCFNPTSNFSKPNRYIEIITNMKESKPDEYREVRKPKPFK